MNVVNYFDRVSSGHPANFGFDSILKRLRAVNPVQPDKGECGNIDKFRASICKFCKTPGNEDYLAICNEEGNVRIENTKHDRKLDVAFRAHNNAIFDLEWSDCHNRLLLGSGDQTASVWDVREGGASKINVFVSHTQSVRSVTFRPFDKDVFATGGRDGRVVIWDVRCASSDVLNVCVKPENIINKAVTRESSGIRTSQPSFSICSLLFQDSVHLFCSSISESCVDVWDMRKNYSFLKRVPQPLYKLKHPDTSRSNFYTSMCLDSSRTRLYANSKDGSIHSFNVASYSSKPESFYTGHTVASTYIKCCLSPDDSYLVSGSSDGKAYVWSTSRPGGAAPIAKLNAHNTELSCVDWCRSGEVKIATCSEDPDYKNCNDCYESESVEADLLMVWRVVTDENETASKKEIKKDEMGTISWEDESAHAHPIRRQSARFFRACRPLINKRPPITELNSPTVNLPNHVIDGTSPLHRCSPSSRKEKENRRRNWLSSLKKKTPSSLNAKSVQIKKSTGAGTGGHKPKACGNLLKFFKAAAREGGGAAPLDTLTEVSNFAEASSLINGVMEI